MTAQEMFEQLGYKKHDHNFFDVPKQTAFPQDEPYLEYVDRSENEGMKAEEHIVFKKCPKVVWVEALLEIGGKMHRTPAPLGYAEVCAIKKQMEELEWGYKK